jgi:glycosidase
MNNGCWFKQAIIYHIFIDRFAGYKSENNWDKPVFLGGNLKGITKKLPYLIDLGVNTIMLSPFYKTSSYHGYHITDYFRVEPAFGSTEDLKELISRAHKSNIRLIADFVPNHCSAKHPYFIYSQSNRKSIYHDWFYFRRWPDKYLCFMNVKQLPKLNLENRETYKHITSSAKYWLDYGIDGFRLDHVVGPSNNFWKNFSREIKNTYPDTVLIGEAWCEGIKYKNLKTLKIRNKYFKWLKGFKQTDTQKEYTGILDGVFDFNFRNRIIEYIAWKEKPDEHKSILTNCLKNHYGSYPPDYYLPSFVDNHDMSRFLFECGQNKEKLKTALTLQFTLPQPPVIYYGTEAGLSHDKPVIPNKPYSDLMARKPMPWNKLDDDLLEYCRELIHTRKKNS